MLADYAPKHLQGSQSYTIQPEMCFSASNLAEKKQDGQGWLIVLQNTSKQANHAGLSQKCALSIILDL